MRFVARLLWLRPVWPPQRREDESCLDHDKRGGMGSKVQLIDDTQIAGYLAAWGRASSGSCWSEDCEPKTGEAALGRVARARGSRRQGKGGGRGQRLVNGTTTISVSYRWWTRPSSIQRARPRSRPAPTVMPGGMPGKPRPRPGRRQPRVPRGWPRWPPRARSRPAHRREAREVGDRAASRAAARP